MVDMKYRLVRHCDIDISWNARYFFVPQWCGSMESRRPTFGRVHSKSVLVDTVCIGWKCTQKSFDCEGENRSAAWRWCARSQQLASPHPIWLVVNFNAIEWILHWPNSYIDRRPPSGECIHLNFISLTFSVIKDWRNRRASELWGRNIHAHIKSNRQNPNSTKKVVVIEWKVWKIDAHHTQQLSREQWAKVVCVVVRGVLCMRFYFL